MIPGASLRVRDRPERPRKLRQPAPRLRACSSSSRRPASALVPHLVSYAVGTLLGVALLSILPEVLEELTAGADRHGPARRHRDVLRAREAGAVAPLPHRGLRGARPRRTAGPAGSCSSATAFHSFVDGVAIGAAVQTSMPPGGQHRHRGGAPRGAAAGGRLRRAAARRLPAGARRCSSACCRRRAPSPGRSPRSRCSITCPASCRSRSRSRRPASSTSRWPT